MVIEKDKVVTLSYQLFSLGQNQEPILLEERSVDDPLEFLFGQGILLAKVEEVLGGKSMGFETEVNLHPRDGFGVHRQDLLTWHDRSHFPKDQELVLGMKFQTQGPGGDVISVIVKEINDDKVLLDGNHPLAGLHLRFVLRVMRVRAATESERVKKEVDPRQLH